jgi:ligand-binding sensor domain-containing protein
MCLKVIYPVFIFMVTTLYGQFLKPFQYHLADGGEYFSNRLRGNGITNILVDTSGASVWVGTGYGLNKTLDGGTSWVSYTSKEYGGKGNSVVGMTMMGDSILWISTGYDTLADGETLEVGGGLHYTADSGKTWVHIPQPKDRRDETAYSPTTTAVQNISWDIAVLDSTIWIASWGGGVRKSSDMGKTWQVITTDNLPFSALNYLNHRGFALMVENGNIWVGTAEGISKSGDGGKTWRRFTHQNQQYPISGNFVVALAYQSYTHTVWAATIEAVDADEVRAVSKSDNGGETWQVMLENTFPHNFAFNDSIVYVAADEGLFVSDNGGENWYKIPPISGDRSDLITGEEILTEKFYSAAVSHEPLGVRLWLGSADGLATTLDNGNTWTVNRSYISTTERKDPPAYAYPTPFSPSRHGYIRFQYHVARAGEVVIDIYDWGMDKVATVREFESDPATHIPDRSAKWDGRNSRGDIVASGVYFFRVEIEGDVTWGKLVVVN